MRQSNLKNPHQRLSQMPVVSHCRHGCRMRNCALMIHRRFVHNPGFWEFYETFLLNQVLWVSSSLIAEHGSRSDFEAKNPRIAEEMERDMLAAPPELPPQCKL